MSRGYRLPVRKLDLARARRAWSYTDLARASDLGIATVSRALAGRPVSMETLRRLGRAFRQHAPLPEVGALLDSDAVAEESGDGLG